MPNKNVVLKFEPKAKKSVSEFLDEMDSPDDLPDFFFEFAEAFKQVGLEFQPAPTPHQPANATSSRK